MKYDSEDAAAVESRSAYCSKINSIVGMNLAFGNLNGIPDASCSLVETATDILNIHKNY